MSDENLIVQTADERIRDLEARLRLADSRLMTSEGKYRHDTDILAGFLNHIIQEAGISSAYLDSYIGSSSWTDAEICDVLEYHEAVPEEWLSREYYVTVTIPVSVCVTVKARNENDAEEKAQDEIDSNGLDNYDMDYNLYYDAEYSVEEA